MKLRAIRRLSVAGPLALGIALAVIVTPALLFAHARLLRSSPAANAKLATPPGGLSLWFSEKPELRFTAIQLTDSAGGVVALGAPADTGSMGISVPISGSLAAGRYTVSWRTAASDGHASSGKFSFSVAAQPGIVVQVAPAAPAAASQSDSTRKKPVSNALVAPAEQTTFSTAMRWVELVALLTIIGIVIFRLAVLPPAKLSNELTAESADRALRLVRAVVVLFAVATLTRAFAQTALIPAANDSRFAALMTLVQHTRWGFAWAIGAVGTAIALLGFLAAGKALAGWVVASVGVVAICVSEALTGHAGASTHLALAVAADVSHVLGAGGWLGGLVALLLCGLPILRRLDAAGAADTGSKLMRAYHGAAVECVTIVVASGIVAAWIRLPRLDALWLSPYGQMLLRKLIFVAVVLAFGLYHWRRIVIPAWTDDTGFRFKRSAVGELVFGAVVIAFTAFLIAEPLP